MEGVALSNLQVSVAAHLPPPPPHGHQSGAEAAALRAVPWARWFSWAASSGDHAESSYLGYLQPHLTHSPETGPQCSGPDNILRVLRCPEHLRVDAWA